MCKGKRSMCVFHVDFFMGGHVTRYKLHDEKHGSTNYLYRSEFYEIAHTQPRADRLLMNQ